MAGSLEAVALAVAVCSLSCGGDGLGVEGEGGTGVQTWSPSLSSGTPIPHDEHLTAGRSCEMRRSGLAIVELKREREKERERVLEDSMITVQQRNTITQSRLVALS